MFPSGVIQTYIDDQTECAITVKEADGTVNTLNPCKIKKQDGDLVQFLYIKTGDDMMYSYHREDIKQVRHEVAS